MCPEGACSMRKGAVNSDDNASERVVLTLVTRFSTATESHSQSVLPAWSGYEGLSIGIIVDAHPPEGATR